MNLSSFREEGTLHIMSGSAFSLHGFVDLLDSDER
jgi:hypothetical protein